MSRDEYQRLKIKYKKLWFEVRKQFKQGKTWRDLDYGLWRDYVEAHWQFIQYRNKLYNPIRHYFPYGLFVGGKTLTVEVKGRGGYVI